MSSLAAEMLKVLIRARDWHDGESENDDWMKIIPEIRAVIARAENERGMTTPEIEELREEVGLWRGRYEAELAVSQSVKATER